MPLNTCFKVGIDDLDYWVKLTKNDDETKSITYYSDNKCTNLIPTGSDGPEENPAQVPHDITLFHY